MESVRTIIARHARTTRGALAGGVLVAGATAGDNGPAGAVADRVFSAEAGAVAGFTGGSTADFFIFTMM